jgi:arginine utilization protein RocB
MWEEKGKASRERHPPVRDVMRKWLWLVPLFALGLAAGCTNSSPEAKRANEKAKKEVREATEATADALRRQKEEYRKKANAELDRLDDQLKTWKEKANRAGADARADLDNRIKQLEAQRDKLRARMAGLKADSKDAWDQAQKGLDKAMDNLKDAFGKAKEEFK